MKLRTVLPGPWNSKRVGGVEICTEFRSMDVGQKWLHFPSVVYVIVVVCANYFKIQVSFPESST